MKKIFLLVLFLCGTFFVAQATYYVGLNQLRDLLQAVEEPILDKSDPPVPVEKLFMPNEVEDNADGVEDGAWCDWDSSDWDNIGGVTWTESTKIPDYMEDDNTPSGTNYYALKSIDWSPAIYSYTQKSDVDIVWVQPDYDEYEKRYEGAQGDPLMIDGEQVLSPTGYPLTVKLARKAQRSVLQRHELRFLQSLNFSGNQFRSISINGNDLMELTSIDLSNNPTLIFLELKNLPMLATLDITGNPSVVLNVENCPDLVITGTYTPFVPTGIVSTPVNNISMSANHGQLIIKGAQNETASIYSVDGRLVRQQKLTAGTSNIALDNNLYIVRLSNGKVRKVIVK